MHHFHGVAVVSAGQREFGVVAVMVTAIRHRAYFSGDLLLLFSGSR